MVSDRMSKEKRSEIMSKIRSKDTSIEIMVRKYLFSKGFRYRKNDKRYPGKPDIVLPKYRTIIFVNGCFWHGHEDCNIYRGPKSNTEYWEKKINKNRIRDINNYTLLREMGWKVIVVWECELEGNKEKILERIVCEIIDGN